MVETTFGRWFQNKFGQIDVSQGEQLQTHQSVHDVTLRGARPNVPDQRAVMEQTEEAENSSP